MFNFILMILTAVGTLFSIVLFELFFRNGMYLYIPISIVSSFLFTYLHLKYVDKVSKEKEKEYSPDYV